MGVPREIIMRDRSPHFAHSFGSPTGYYSYRWLAVPDTDAFTALYRYAYSAGSTADPMELYQAFRGREPDTSALMRSLGFA
jgi:peptidyl-dipeptidase Dcp